MYVANLFLGSLCPHELLLQYIVVVHLSYCMVRQASSIRWIAHTVCGLYSRLTRYLFHAAIQSRRLLPETIQQLRQTI
jgi:hypothetical protein